MLCLFVLPSFTSGVGGKIPLLESGDLLVCVLLPHKISFFIKQVLFSFRIIKWYLLTLPAFSDEVEDKIGSDNETMLPVFAVLRGDGSHVGKRKRGNSTLMNKLVCFINAQFRHCGRIFLAFLSLHI